MTQIQDLQNLVLDAVEVIEFKLVRNRDDVNDPTKSFRPIMAHQIFGENENIFGYKDLKVQVYYTAGPLQIYIGMFYSSKAEDFFKDGIKSDDVIGTIAKKLPNGCYFTNLEEFLKTLEKSEKFRPFGDKLCEHIVDDERGVSRHFEFYQCDFIQPKFSSYFARLQTFVLWFVDAAQYIDIDDPQWKILTCYERYKNSNGNYEYGVVGYTSVYQYYAYPEHIRPRISQMLVLPCFQRLGIGTKFIETVYKCYSKDLTVIDITVEDPSEDFQRLRNFVDSRVCKELPAFSVNLIHKGFTKDMIKEAKDSYKINAFQCRKVYEIIRLFHTNRHNPTDYKSYRLDVKKRLNLHYYKQLRDLKKVEKAGVDTQWLEATIPKKEERLEQLNAEYNELEEEYSKIVEKLKNC